MVKLFLELTSSLNLNKYSIRVEVVLCRKNSILLFKKTLALELNFQQFKFFDLIPAEKRLKVDLK
jgi:hypothetical protein